MAVKLRLRRMGKKRQPVFKVVAADARSPRDGRFIEAIGLYNPKTDPATIEIKEDRALYWLGVGAQPTTTVKGLLSKKGILLKHDLIKRGVSEDKIEVQVKEWEKLQEAKLASLEKKKEEKAKAEAEKKKAEEEAKAKAEEEAKAEEVSQEEQNSDAPEAEGTVSEEGSAEA
ncbi:MAG: 30S ribosomal protein S16 [Ignavibacteria bacterium]|nr:MAG: 30S ribosomal protein S16 [Ignavibacteria bacterium]